MKLLNHRDMKKNWGKDFQLSYDKAERRMFLNLGHMKDGEWASYMDALENIEQFMIEEEEFHVDLKCRMVDDTSTLYVMHVLKLAERYQWLGEKKITINCDLGLGKSYRFWLKQKLRRCFELDIRFTRLNVAASMIF